MAEPLPAALKIPEVSRFINRANQLRTIKPAIAYWCEYHAVNQIVGKSLHTTDDDCFAFTKTLIERLEATKAEHADDDAIVDNDAGQAYVEQFAHETFVRAERTLRANKVTRQTADTFDAAATFFDLTHEWGAPDAETLQKIKFAKWNAARILRAIREGRDPNESNPQPAAPGDDAEPPLNPDDPDVRELLGPGAAPQPASVEDAPDAPPAQEGYFPPGPSAPPPPEPFAPSPMSQSPAAETTGVPPRSAQIPPQPSPQIPTKLPPGFVPPPPPPTDPGLSGPPPQSWAPAPRVPPPAAPPSAPAHTPAVPPPVPVAAAGTATSLGDINQAQKHAKWAISALNFEDVPTAVAELRNALAILGAQ